MFFLSLKKEMKEASVRFAQSEISMASSYLQDLPNSIRTASVMGTAVSTSYFRLGARYPILLMRSFEMSFLY